MRFVVLVLVGLGLLALAVEAVSMPDRWRPTNTDARTMARYGLGDYASALDGRLVVGPTKKHGKSWRELYVRVEGVGSQERFKVKVGGTRGDVVMRARRVPLTARQRAIRAAVRK